jgi:uridine kinase
VDTRRPLTGTFAALADRVLTAPPLLGATRLVCIDGPAGSGKTTFAGGLGDALSDAAVVLHLEDLYAGWTLTGAVARLCAGVLRPLSEGRPGAHHVYDWHTEVFGAEPVPVPLAPVLIVEGCGSSPRALDPWTTLRIWVDAPLEQRLARGLARDGAHLAQHWLRWQATELAVIAAEDTRGRADIRVDGGAADRLAEGTFALLDG